ncbi:hypothetical protein CWB96_14530 [Pseudoalteromonas citrea]|uniref:Uncharacterized protein n=1 Tax=Pseudoalteromonas citrea TaxID=43655 RepID=A0A5S3XPU8_9GAMM|nr:hypothetical protein [Pseudoalteromonas citrea]TMP40149.1 hypothetical protein CWB97_19870 [Pseudoalteromonas citrea]TMP56863.1 hypothetical protein CWB96_14530 [Pseudoalteromonas citrea]
MKRLLPMVLFALASTSVCSAEISGNSNWYIDDCHDCSDGILKNGIRALTGEHSGEAIPENVPAYVKKRAELRFAEYVAVSKSGEKPSKETIDSYGSFNFFTYLNVHTGVAKKYYQEHDGVNNYIVAMTPKAHEHTLAKHKAEAYRFQQLLQDGVQAELNSFNGQINIYSDDYSSHAESCNTASKYFTSSYCRDMYNRAIREVSEQPSLAGFKRGLTSALSNFSIMKDVEFASVMYKGDDKASFRVVTPFPNESVLEIETSVSLSGAVSSKGAPAFSRTPSGTHMNKFLADIRGNKWSGAAIDAEEVGDVYERDGYTCVERSAFVANYQYKVVVKGNGDVWLVPANEFASQVSMVCSR